MNTSAAVVSLFALVTLSGFMIGAMYLGGGTEALRRQARMIAALIGAVAVGLFVVLPIADAQFGSVPVALVLLAITLSLNVARSRRSGVSLTKPIPDATGRTSQRRLIVLVWLVLSVLLIGGTTVIAIVLRH